MFMRCDGEGWRRKRRKKHERKREKFHAQEADARQREMSLLFLETHTLNEIFEKDFFCSESLTRRRNQRDDERGESRAQL